VGAVGNRLSISTEPSTSSYRRNALVVVIPACQCWISSQPGADEDGRAIMSRHELARSEKNAVELTPSRGRPINRQEI
jgi:hypothetical protein